MSVAACVSVYPCVSTLCRLIARNLKFYPSSSLTNTTIIPNVITWRDLRIKVKPKTPEIVKVPLLSQVYRCRRRKLTGHKPNLLHYNSSEAQQQLCKCSQLFREGTRDPRLKVEGNESGWKGSTLWWQRCELEAMGEERIMGVGAVKPIMARPGRHRPSPLYSKLDATQRTHRPDYRLSAIQNSLNQDTSTSF